MSFKYPENPPDPFRPERLRSWARIMRKIAAHPGADRGYATAAVVLDKRAEKLERRQGNE